MKIIKPIVGVSKIIDNYDTVVSGFNGVLYDGLQTNAEALHALKKCAAHGKKVSILTNAPLRVEQIARILSPQGNHHLSFLENIISAGELLHYQLKNAERFGLSGNKYYNLGGSSDVNVFSGLDYQQVKRLDEADFVFSGNVKSGGDTIESYQSLLEHAVALSLPMVSVGNDTATFERGVISLGAGALAEQYAVLGGKIFTCGKPQPEILSYAAENSQSSPERVLFIGDSFTTDVKSGNLFNADTVLISKGIHVNFLGEGYIPDVEKARFLAMNFDVYPDYVISSLRW